MINSEKTLLKLPQTLGMFLHLQMGFTGSTACKQFLTQPDLFAYSQPRLKLFLTRKLGLHLTKNTNLNLAKLSEILQSMV